MKPDQDDPVRHLRDVLLLSRKVRGDPAAPSCTLLSSLRSSCRIHKARSLRLLAWEGHQGTACYHAQHCMLWISTKTVFWEGGLPESYYGCTGARLDLLAAVNEVRHTRPLLHVFCEV